MSHFICLVVGEPVEELLYPFHELESTMEQEEIKNDERSEFEVELEEKDVENTFANERYEHNRYKNSYFSGSNMRKMLERYDKCFDNLHLWINEYHGYDYLKGKGYGFWTNPNAKWDWYNLDDNSMRWSNTFTAHDGSKSNKMVKKDIAKFSYDNFSYVTKYPPAVVMKVDGEPKWIEKGEIGWWATIHNPCGEWESYFENLWKQIPEDEIITAVDCHI